MAQAREDSLDFVQVAVLGSGWTGKSALIKRYLREEFHEVNTLGVEFATIALTLEDKRVRASLWDTQGHWKAYGIIQPFLRRIAGAMIVVDSSAEHDSVDKPRVNEDRTVTWQPGTNIELVEQYIRDVRAVAGPSTPFVIVANKADQGVSPHVRALQSEVGSEVWTALAELPAGLLFTFYAAGHLLGWNA